MESKQANHLSPWSRLRLHASLAAMAVGVVASIAYLESRQAMAALLIAVVAGAWLLAASKAPRATGVLSLALLLGISVFALLAVGIYRARQNSLSETVMDRQQQIGRALHEQEVYSKHDQ